MRFAGFRPLLLCASGLPIIGLAQNASDIDKIAEDVALTVTDIGAEARPPTSPLHPVKPRPLSSTMENASTCLPRFVYRGSRSQFYAPA